MSRNNLYRTAAYAQCFDAPFQAIEFSMCQSWALRRPIADTAYTDVIGTYPLWYGTPTPRQHIADYLAQTGDVSFVAVVPEGYQPQDWDYQRVFKTHYMSDLQIPTEISSHHRYEIRRAEKLGIVAKVIQLKDYLSVWTALYQQLVDRHQITGMTAFSSEYFNRLSQCAEIVTIAAFQNDAPIAMHIFAITDDHLTSHLAGTTDEGYRTGAMYVVNAHTIEWAPSQGYKFINWGGCAGSQDQVDGLSKFKQGFSNKTQASYVVGVIGRADVYEKLSASKRREGFFPAYRSI